MSSPTVQITLDELPARLRMLSDEMQLIGMACDYYGGFGAFGEYGRMLQEQSAPIARELATAMEKMRGGRA